MSGDAMASEMRTSEMRASERRASERRASEARGKLGLEPGEVLSYDRAVSMARDPDPRVRRALASLPDLSPELLYFLAADTDSEVRRQIAGNAATPVKADLLLVEDEAEEVRGDLAVKIATVAPDLSENERDRVQQMSISILERLAADQIPKVRQILSEALKDVAHAPADVIRRLARDAEIAVSGPVLQFSPVLSETDLLDIIAGAPATGALTAISKRQNVRESVADAIAATDDVSAITALLANPSAQIREETLDALVERAPTVEQWHEPLVKRPKLPQNAAARLARFVADRLLAQLTQRNDLSPSTARAVAAVVHRRLEQEDLPSSGKALEKSPYGITPGAPAARKRAQTMARSGTLNEDVLKQAMQADDRDFLEAALAVLGGVPFDAARAMIQSQDPRAMTALVWRAGLSPRFAVHAQVRLANIPPDGVLRANPDAFPMSDDEMSWQVEYFTGHAAESM